MKRQYPIQIYTTFKNQIPKISFVQHDTEVNRIYFEFLDDINVPMKDISYATLTVKRFDGNTYTYGMIDNGRLVFIIEDNLVTVIFPPGAVYTAGECQASISLYDTDMGRLTTQTFKYTVTEELIGDTPIDETNDYPILTELITKTENLKSTYEAAINGSAESQALLQVSNAKKTFDTLEHKVDDIDSKIGTNAQGINNLGTAIPLKADKSYVDSKFNAVDFYLKDYTSYVVNGDWAPALQKANDDIVASGKYGVIHFHQLVTLKTKVSINASLVSIDGHKNGINTSTIVTGEAIEVLGTVAPPYAQNLCVFEDFELYGVATTNGIKFTSSVTNAGGMHITLRNLNIHGMNAGIRYENGACLIKHHNVNVYNCVTGLEMVGSFTNYGENMSYFGCSIFNNTLGVYSSNYQSDFNFFGCSLDYNTQQITVNRARINLYGCHSEGTTFSQIQFTVTGNGGVINIQGGSIYYNGELHTAYFAQVDAGAYFQVDNAFVGGIKNTFNKMCNGAGTIIVNDIKSYTGDTQNTLVSDNHNMLIDGGFEGASVIDNISIYEDSVAVSNRLTGTNIIIDQSSTEHNTGAKSLRIKKPGGLSTLAGFHVYVPIEYGQKIDASFNYKCAGFASGKVQANYCFANVTESKDGLHNVRVRDIQATVDMPVTNTVWTGHSIGSELVVNKKCYNYLIIYIDLYYAAGGASAYLYLDDFNVSVQ